MKTAIIIVFSVIAIFFAFIIQERIPPVQDLMGARILFVPLLFCYAALTLPLWATLVLGFYTGLLTDLWYIQAIGGQVEIALGWSIVYFVLFGLLAHGFQPGFERGHWWLHPLLSALGTSVILALQFVMITFRREQLIVNEIVLWRIVAPGIFAAIAALIFVLAARYLEDFLPGNDRRRMSLET